MAFMLISCGICFMYMTVYSVHSITPKLISMKADIEKVNKTIDSVNDDIKCFYYKLVCHAN